MSSKEQTVVTQRTEIMNSDHPKWEEFSEMLGNPPSHIQKEMDSESQDGDYSYFNLLEKILETFEDVDVHSTLDHFRSFCLCDDSKMVEMFAEEKFRQSGQASEGYKLFTDLRLKLFDFCCFWTRCGYSAEYYREAVKESAGHIIDGFCNWLDRLQKQSQE